MWTTAKNLKASMTQVQLDPKPKTQQIAFNPSIGSVTMKIPNVEFCKPKNSKRHKIFPFVPVQEELNQLPADTSMEKK